MRGSAGARLRFVPGWCWGRARAKPETLTFTRREAAAGAAYLAATAVLTSISVPFTVPVIVAFFPAC